MRSPSGLVCDSPRTPRSPPRSATPARRPSALHGVSSFLVLAMIIAAMGSVTLVFSRVGRGDDRPTSASRLLRSVFLSPVNEQTDDNLVSIFPPVVGNMTSSDSSSVLPKVLILTPVKNSARHLARFFNNIRSLSYPRDRLSLGMLESDSDDPIPSPLLTQLESIARRTPGIPALDIMLNEYESKRTRQAATTEKNSTGNSSVPHPSHVHGLAIAKSTRMSGTLALILAEVPLLQAQFGRVSVFQHDFGLQLSREERHAQSRQLTRRAVLARSRNHLLLSALRDEDYVLWVDSDLVSYPADIIQSLIGSKKQIVTPHCVMERGGRSYDLNSWRVKGDGKLGNNATLHDVRAYHASLAKKAMASSDPRKLLVEGYDNNHEHVYLQHLRTQGPVVRLDAVGGAMLLVDAELHRQGLVFPPFVYGYTGRIETEGLSMMALDMGILSWGMPDVEIYHN